MKRQCVKTLLVVTMLAAGATVICQNSVAAGERGWPWTLASIGGRIGMMKRRDGGY
jgi:hypothetical protein